MATTLPYLSTPGTIDTALGKIKQAATPTRFTSDFVKTVLQVRGGTGAAIPPFLKKLGFLNSDGTPTALYDRLRNDATSGNTIAEAMRMAYRPLFEANEYAHRLGDSELKGLIVQVTGAKKDDRVAELTFATLKRLRAHARFDGAAPVALAAPRALSGPNTEAGRGGADVRAFTLGYSITLNLPTSTNVDVYNAIFRSLREHLLHD